MGPGLGVECKGAEPISRWRWSLGHFGDILQQFWKRFTTFGRRNGSIGLPFNLIIDRETMVVKGLLGSPTYQAAATLCDQ